MTKGTRSIPVVMHRNVVLVCLDSVRKDYFETHARRLQELASVSFEQCRAASSWSVPSHASMMTGELPHQHGVHTHNRDFLTIDRERTLFDRLPEAYRTVGISANVYAGPSHGFDTFFDEFVNVPRYQYFTDGLNATEFVHNAESSGLTRHGEYLAAALGHEEPLKSLLNGALAQTKRFSMGRRVPDPVDDGARAASRAAANLIAETDRPTFAFMNLMEAHAPHSHFHGLDRSLHSAPLSWRHTTDDYWDVVTDPESHAEHVRMLRELYAASIDYLDRVVAALIATIQRRVERETTVIVTADHGENLLFPAEDGLLGHKSSLSESLLHVPLAVINPPDGARANESGYVSHCRLPELIAGLANDSLPDVSDARVAAELVGLSGGPEPPNEREWWDRMQRCVYDGSRKVVWDSLGGVSAYDLDGDRPCWQVPVEGGGDVPAWADAFFDRGIREYKQSASENERRRAVDTATQRRLADLGYL
jgi:arylsulfatase A-like enzyme